jgi:hypothetical protein
MKGLLLGELSTSLLQPECLLTDGHELFVLGMNRPWQTSDFQGLCVLNADFVEAERYGFSLFHFFSLAIHGEQLILGSEEELVILNRSGYGRQDIQISSSSDCLLEHVSVNHLLVHDNKLLVAASQINVYE